MAWLDSAIHVCQHCRVPIPPYVKSITLSTGPNRIMVLSHNGYGRPVRILDAIADLFGWSVYTGQGQWRYRSRAAALEFATQVFRRESIHV